MAPTTAAERAKEGAPPTAPAALSFRGDGGRPNHSVLIGPRRAKEAKRRSMPTPWMVLHTKVLCWNRSTTAPSGTDMSKKATEEKLKYLGEAEEAKEENGDGMGNGGWKTEGGKRRVGVGGAVLGCVCLGEGGGHERRDAGTTTGSVGGREKVGNGDGGWGERFGRNGRRNMESVREWRVCISLKVRARTDTRTHAHTRTRTHNTAQVHTHTIAHNSTRTCTATHSPIVAVSNENGFALSK